MRRALLFIGSIVLLTSVVGVPAAAARAPRVSLSTDAREVSPGGTLTYSITVADPGGAAAGRAVLTAALPRQTAVIGIAAGGRTACTAHGPTLVRCVFGRLSPGGRARVSIQAVVRPGAAGRLRAWASVGGVKVVSVARVVRRADLAVRLHAAGRGPGRTTVTATVLDKVGRVRDVTLLAAVHGRVLHYRGARCGRVRRVYRCSLGAMRGGRRRSVAFDVRPGTTVAVTVEPEAGDRDPRDNSALLP